MTRRKLNALIYEKEGFNRFASAELLAEKQKLPLPFILYIALYIAIFQNHLSLNAD